MLATSEPLNGTLAVYLHRLSISNHHVFIRLSLLNYSTCLLHACGSVTTTVWLRLLYAISQFQQSKRREAPCLKSKHPLLPCQTLGMRNSHRFPVKPHQQEMSKPVSYDTSQHLSQDDASPRTFINCISCTKYETAWAARETDGYADHSETLQTVVPRFGRQTIHVATAAAASHSSRVRTRRSLGVVQAELGHPSLVAQYP